jgi:hypothetical protein
MPLIGSWTEIERISGPVCADGGHLSATLSIAQEMGKNVITLHASCVNTCLTDNLEPYVMARIIDTDGNEVSQIASELPMTPGKGWPWNGNPERHDDQTLELYTAFKVSRIEFTLKNQAHGSPILDIVNFAVPLIVELLGGAFDVARPHIASAREAVKPRRTRSATA